jgi:predicted nucleotidyltransferase
MFSGGELLVRHQAERLKKLLKWREHVPAIARAVREVLGGVEAYAFGSAAKGNLRASSDVDVAVILCRHRVIQHDS